MDSPKEKEQFKANFSVKNRLKKTTSDQKKEIFDGRKSTNTNRVTRTWVTCFNEYLVEKQIQPKPELSIEELPQILSDFYVDLHKKNVKKLGDSGKVIPQAMDECEDYKNTSLKCI